MYIGRYFGRLEAPLRELSVELIARLYPFLSTVAPWLRRQLTGTEEVDEPAVSQAEADSTPSPSHAPLAASVQVPMPLHDSYAASSPRFPVQVGDRDHEQLPVEAALTPLSRVNGQSMVSATTTRSPALHSVTGSTSPLPVPGNLNDESTEVRLPSPTTGTDSGQVRVDWARLAQEAWDTYKGAASAVPALRTRCGSS
jgi:hypothetical protein